jgi:hypothetical protein
MPLQVREAFHVACYETVARDFLEFYSQLQDLRPTVQSIGRQGIVSYLAKTAVLKLDYWTYFPEERPKQSRAPLLDAIQVYEDRLREILVGQQHRVLFPDIDFSCELSLFPLHDSRLVGLLSAANPQIREFIEGQSWFEPYDFDSEEKGYEGVLELEWLRRQRDWSEVFPHPQANPDLSGIRIMLAPLRPYWPEATPQWPYPSVERIVQSAPSYEYRTRLITETSLWHAWSAERELDHEPGAAIKHALAFRQWIDSPSGRMSAQLQVESVRNVLIKNVQPGHLFQQFVLNNGVLLEESPGKPA